MEPSKHSYTSPSTFNKEEEDQKYNETREKYYEIVPNLAKSEGWIFETLVHYQGCWMYPSIGLLPLLLIRDHFKPFPTDVFLASSPKTGTTWLRALIFSIMNRSRYDFCSHPLLQSNPHDLFPYLEPYMLNSEWCSSHESPSLPRLFATHYSYTLLPESITSSGSKFVYICRDPKDVIISFTFFLNKLDDKQKDYPPLSIEDAFDLFCQGISPHGPYWDHVLGYWKASLENPDRILFLKYEEMKKEPSIYVRKLAEFLGQPFSKNEEKEGTVEEIIKLCSFDSLRNSEVNKARESSSRPDFKRFGNDAFFRKGKVGDWENHLTPEMATKIDLITEEKLRGSGFFFGCSL